MNMIKLNHVKFPSFSWMLRYHNSVIVLLLLCALAGLTSCHKKSENPAVVARVEQFDITTNDLLDQFKARYPDQAVERANKSLKKRVLDDMIDQQLILMEAYRLGLDKSDTLKKDLAEKEQELATEEFLQQTAKPERISEDLLREYYGLMAKVFDLSFIRVNLGASDEEKMLARKKANEIYRLLQAGANFRQLAATRSEHGSAAADSGKFSHVDCFSLDQVLFKRLHAMKEGEISEPIEADDALFILRLDKIYSNKMAEFSIVRMEIQESLEKMQQNQRSQKIAKLERTLRKKHHYTLYPDQVDFFCLRTKQMKSSADTLTLFTNQERQLPLSRTDIGVITIGEFLPKVAQYYWDSLFQRRVTDMLLEYMNTKRLFKHAAMEQKLNESEKIKQQLDLFTVQTLKEGVIEQEVLKKINPSDAELRPLYEAGKSQFLVPAQVTVHEIFCRTKEEIDRVHALAVTAKDFSLLQKKYSQDEETRTNGVLGPFSKGRNGKLGELAFSGMKVGEISEPFKYRGGWSFFKLLAFTPARTETFETVKEKLKVQYLNENKDRYLSDWLKSVRANYSITYYDLP